MIAELGHYLLVLALAMALVQAVVPLIGAARGDAALMAAGRGAAMAQMLAIGAAFACLTVAFVTSDFSVLLVASNSHTAKPLLYKITGVWGNHEGSLLLWALILSLYGGAVALFGRNLPPTLRARVLSVQGMIAIGFLLFMLLTSNPFERLMPPPAEGRDLNPLLQDPGLAFHPPFLYLGYVGFSIAFAFAIAALIEGRVDAAWARWVRPWTLAAWVFLTIGIALGSWWAYYELGWGGWWFWDPVENASLMPWMAGTALLHSAIVVEKRDTLKSWTILLAILTFSLSLLGTFIVRSGVITSVHAFASDPTRGVFVLVFMCVVVGGGLALYAWRAPALKPGGLFAPVSRESGLVVNNLLLAALAATVLIGTLYPLFLDAFAGTKVTVGPPFFDATVVPLAVPLLIVAGMGPSLAWKRGDLGAVLQRLRFAMVAALLAAAAGFAIGGFGVDGALGALGMMLGVWLVAASLTDIGERVWSRRGGGGRGGAWRRARGLPRSAWGTAIAHCGVGILVLGITGASIWQSERTVTLAPGDRAEIGGRTLEFRGVTQQPGPNYRSTMADLRLITGGSTVDGAMIGGRVVGKLAPEIRYYPTQGTTTTEAAIRTNGVTDVYVALAGAEPVDGKWSFRLYHNPLTPWIWGGALVMAAGGMVSLSDRRLRVGAPRRARNPAPGTVPAE
ncbi:heme lyase CcmF/NrfE family subunit [Tistrella bauzanensis]|uniref:Heme lyase CcmF/NrfE family subunit n=1 Tax=Tistrella arctica TaxID=3133430 RepID=A0ABU9YFI9_9PROT